VGIFLRIFCFLFFFYYILDIWVFSGGIWFVVLPGGFWLILFWHRIGVCWDFFGAIFFSFKWIFRDMDFVAYSGIFCEGVCVCACD